MTATEKAANQEPDHQARGQAMDPFADPDHIAEIRTQIRELCARFPDTYWRDLDAGREYPEAFVRAMTEAGWLGR